MFEFWLQGPLPVTLVKSLKKLQKKLKDQSKVLQKIKLKLKRSKKCPLKWMKMVTRKKARLPADVWENEPEFLRTHFSGRNEAQTRGSGLSKPSPLLNVVHILCSLGMYRL